MKMREELAGKVAMVTGAGSGIGRAIALALASRGARLLLLGRNVASLAAVAEACAADSRPTVMSIDLTHDEHVMESRRVMETHGGELDVLVHSAGVLIHGALEDLPLEQFDRLYRTNLRAPFALTQALLPCLRARSGQVVFINSTAGISVAPHLGAYASLKHALRSLADTWRVEVNADGVRVLSVFPGRTATPMQSQLHEMEGSEYRPGELLQPEDVAEAVVNALVMPRTAEVTEVRVRPFQRRARALD